MLIDTHTHVVAENQEKYPLVPGYEASWYHEIPISADRLLELMQESSVDRAMLVQGYGPYKDDNSYAADAALSMPQYFSSVGVVDPKKDPVGRLTYWAKERGMRGVRLIVRDPGPAGAEVTAAHHTIWQHATELGIVVCLQIQISEGHVAWLRDALKHFPGTPIALDHCGFPNLSGGPPYEKARRFWALADLPEVHLKVSSINLSQAGENGGDPRRFVEQLARTFGADRLMWGSDYSQTNHMSYQGFVDLARHSSSTISTEEQNWFSGETALKFWPELRPRHPN